MPAYSNSYFNSSQLLRFTVVGILNTLIDFGVLNALIGMLGVRGGIAILVCNAVAFLAANLCSYFCNRSWTFARTASASFKEYAAYFGISLVGLLLNSLVLWLLTGGVVEGFWQLNLAKVGATLVSMVWNFCGYRLLLSR
jgi:putative flippase GtrA